MRLAQIIKDRKDDTSLHGLHIQLNERIKKAQQDAQNVTSGRLPANTKTELTLLYSPGKTHSIKILQISKELKLMRHLNEAIVDLEKSQLKAKKANTNVTSQLLQ